MLNKLLSKTERLKSQARKHYMEYHREADKLDCGKSIGEVINPRMLSAKLAFNKVMDKLSKLDPNCPKQRL